MAFLKEMKDLGQNRPESWEVLYYHGLIHMERADFTAAVESFEKALSLKKNQSILKSLDEAKSFIPSSTQLIRATDSPHGTSITSVAISGDSKWAIAICGDKYKILNMSDCKWTADRIVHGSKEIFLSHDGKMALSAGKYNDMSLLDLYNNNLLKNFKGCGKKITSLIMTDRWIASGCGDCIIYLWDMYRLKEINGKDISISESIKLEGHKSPVIALHFTGKELISAGHDESLIYGICLHITVQEVLEITMASTVYVSVITVKMRHLHIMTR